MRFLTNFFTRSECLVYHPKMAADMIKTLRHTVVNLNTERKVKMKTKQTNKSENETLYDLRIEHVQLAPTYILPRSPKVERLNRMTLLDVYHALVQRREPILKKWILANCRFNGKGAKANFAIYSIPAADLKKLDRYLAADPLQLVNEAIRQEWTENRMIVIQRGKINILWKVRIAKRKRKRGRRQTPPTDLRRGRLV